MNNLPSFIEISVVEQLTLSLEEGVLTLRCLALNSGNESKIDLRLSREAIIQLSSHFAEMKQLLTKA